MRPRPASHLPNWFAALLMATALCLFPGCSPAPERESDSGDATELTQAEMEVAVAAAEQKVQSEQADITAATVKASPGTVSDSNTGQQCSSGRLLRITLIGTFPHVTTGGPTPGPHDAADADVHAMVLTADATSGLVCKISVKTGEVTPDPTAANLVLN